MCAHSTFRRPFLKWAGGKYRLLGEITGQLPVGKCLIEPFVGSGVVFLNTQYEHFILADQNPDLITLYRVIQADAASFIDAAAAFFQPSYNQPSQYYALREQFNDSQDPIERSLLFLYLNRHGYNGLCRYNKKGMFNVPFGRYKAPYFPRTELGWFAEKAKQAEFLQQDFRVSMDPSRLKAERDVVYCDPPYCPLSGTANFTSYHTQGFTQEDQVALAELAVRLQKKGVPVLISNHDTEYTRLAYRKAHYIPLSVARFISCKGAKRGKAPEVLACFI